MIGRRRNSGLATAAVLVALGVMSAPAQAGTYTVHACKRADLQPAGFDRWTKTVVGAESFDVNYCAQGGSRLLFMRASQPHPPGDRNQLSFSAPPDTTIFAYSIWRSVRIMRSSAFDYAYTLAQGHSSVVVDQCSGKAGCAALGNPNDPGASGNEFWQFGLQGVRRLWLTLRCAGNATCGRLTTDAPAKLWIHRADIHLEDPHPPELAAPLGGPLATSRAPVMGVQHVWITATDRGSGVREAVAEVDGREIARGVLDDNGGLCREPYTRAVPCKRQVSGALAIDTSRLRDGAHTLRVRIGDATRSNTGTSSPVAFQTANSCRLAPRGISRRVHASVALRSGTRRARTVTSRFGRRPTLSGTLETAGGAPVGGATMCIVERRDLTGARPAFRAWLRTDAQGRFSYRIPKGSSRRLYAVHAAPDGQAVASVNVRVRPVVTLRPERRRLRNGEVLGLEGRVRGGPIPRRGVLVELQAWRGTRWQTFGTTRARARGKYEFDYRFSRTTGVQRYRMRARVPDQSGYPYAAGASRPVTVRVEG
jgi:hypothetical protein